MAHCSFDLCVDLTLELGGSVTSRKLISVKNCPKGKLGCGVSELGYIVFPFWLCFDRHFHSLDGQIVDCVGIQN